MIAIDVKRHIDRIKISVGYQAIERLAMMAAIAPLGGAQVSQCIDKEHIENSDVSIRANMMRYPCQSGDEPPHQIRSYTLLFSLFLHFPYVADPPLRTSAPTRPRSRSHDYRTRSIGPISLI